MALLRVESNEDIDCIDDARDIAKDGEQQADAELHLFKIKGTSTLSFFFASREINTISMLSRLRKIS